MRHQVTVGWLCLGMLGVWVGRGAEPSAASKFPCPESEVAGYTAHRAVGKVVVDGRLDEAAWTRLPQSPRFRDIITGGATRHDTRAMVCWDDENLYVAYRVEEPRLQARFKNRNDPIYYDNDVELFVAGRDAYYELEVNAYNTRYEAFFIWADAHEKGGFGVVPEFRRERLQGFNGVGFTTHPRGPRLGSFEWTFPGLRTAVAVDGTLNDDSDVDRGWTVEIALPWKGMEWLAKADGRSFPPKEGDEWRMDFSRFNTTKEPPPARDSGGWVWTRHGAWDSHIPECFVRVRFSTQPPPPGP